jgi:hypothetical protein
MGEKYIDNEELLEEIKKFKKTKKYSERLGEMILLIANNYSTLGSFNGYTWKDDMVGEAVLTCLKYLHNFDPDKQIKPNPFAYIGTIVHRSFVNYIKKQKKHKYIKDYCYNNCYLLEDSEYFYIKSINYEKMRPVKPGGEENK